MDLSPIKDLISPEAYTYYTEMEEKSKIVAIASALEEKFMKNRLISLGGEQITVAVSGSAELGMLGENYVESIITYPVDNISRNPHSADLEVLSPHGRILVEVKNYSSAIPKKEVKKFERDMECMKNKIIGGIFISLNTPIYGVRGIVEFRGMWTHNPIFVYLQTRDKDLINNIIAVVDDYADRRSRGNLDRSKLMSVIDEICCFNTDIASTLDMISTTKHQVMSMFDELYKKINIAESGIRNAIRRSGYIINGELPNSSYTKLLRQDEIFKHITMIGSFYKEKLFTILKHISDTEMRIIDVVGNKELIIYDEIKIKVKFMSTCMDVGFPFTGSLYIPESANVKNGWVVFRVTPSFIMEDLYNVVDQLLLK